MATERTELRGSLSKGLSILASFDEKISQLSASEISERTGINRASVYRLAGQLEELGYLRRDGANFLPSSKVLNLGVAAAQSVEMVEYVRPYLDRIGHDLPDATAINYGVLDGEEVIYLLRLQIDDLISIRLQVGSRLPAYLSSLGKAILAAMPRKDGDQIIKRMRFVPHTPNTVDSAKRLRADLTLTRERGLAVNDEELTIGLRSVAAAVFRGSEVVGAVNVATLTTRADIETLVGEYGPIITKVVAEISADLSAYGGPPGEESA